MEKSKKFRMPAGIRNKLMAAVAMLLVSSIMMVTSTYAWFTLSTAPEVTGITTSVGANGNLEMALLTTETYGQLDNIASAVGNSSAAQEVEKANVTWGNLVDLSEVVYGLHTINLQPSRLNFKYTAAADGQTGGTYDGTTLSNFTGPLMVPTYGKDGRVALVDRGTYSTVYDGTKSAWSFVQDSQKYGVRAIGTNDNLTPQEAGLMDAKRNYASSLKDAQNAVQTALSTNGNALAGAITALAMGQSAEQLTEDQKTAIGTMLSASNTALNHIDAAYKQVLLAYVAAAGLEETVYTAAVTAINGAASYSAALSALQAAASTVEAPSILTDPAKALEDQKKEVAEAQSLYAGTDSDSPDYTGALAKLVDTKEVIINGFKNTIGEDDSLWASESTINGAVSSKIVNDGGAVVEMPDGSGVFAYVGSVAGNYSASCKVNIVFNGLDLPNINATMKTTATEDTVVGQTVNALKVDTSTSTGSTTTVLSDTYGYALDFAFRTNAAESYLQLQTAGVQRVYGDSTSAATQGAGSSMTFNVTTTDAGAATLSPEQVKSLMGAIRVAFVTPAAASGDSSATVHAIAALENINEGTDGFKGDLYLMNYEVDNATGALKIGEKKTKTDDANVVNPTIMKLNQNEAARLTAIVYLDGDLVDNGDVANAAQSLVGSMNLQFSSSAELIPMQNTALHNMVITYTELETDAYKVGLHEFNGNLYTINTGYKIYKGSDNTVYFGEAAADAEPTTYTKLTVMNVNTVLKPVTVTVDGTTELTFGGTTTLTAKSTAGTVSNVAWTVTGDAVSITSDETTADATVVLTADKAGTAKATGKVTLTFPVAGDESKTVTANSSVEVTVTVKGATQTPAG